MSYSPNFTGNQAKALSSVQINGSSSGTLTQSAAAATSSYSVFWPGSQAGGSNYALVNDGAGNLSWASLSSGSVVSVGLSLPASVFTITNSPVTSSGTLTGSLNTQNANSVWAGPSSGSAAAPTFRALVSADIPSLPYLSSSLMTTAGDLIYENLSPAPARLPIGSTGQVLTVVGGLPAWVSPAPSGVTSVGLADGSTTPIYAISNSPVTSTGTLTFTLQSQSANMVLAGPSSGSSAQPTFRALVAADIPNLSSTYVTQSEVGAASGVASLDSSGKIPSAQLPSVVMEYQGAWNPSTNTPTLSDGTGTNGYVYYVTAAYSGTVAGLTDPSMTNFQIGDLVIYSSSVGKWQLVTPAAGVQSVNGAQGAVTVNAIEQLTGDVTAGPASGSQSVASLIASIQGTAVSGTTGSGNVAFSASPTFTGTIAAAAMTLSSTLVATGAISGSNLTSGGHASLDLLASNNLSDVSSTSSAFANISPLTTAGDIIYENSTPAPARLPIGSTGQVLTVVSGLPAWASPATSGTVTSVALADSTNTFNISGSPVTNSGTLTLSSFKSQAANAFLAAPNGSSGAPSFRAIVAADIPTLNQNTTGTAANITATSNSTLTTLSALSLPGSQVTGNIAGNAANITATTNSTLTTLSALTTASSLSSVGTIVSGVWQGSAIAAPYMLALPINQIYVGNSSNQPAAVAMSGDATIASSGALTLATVNSNVGTFGSSTAIPVVTVNAKGLVTAVSTAAAPTLTSLGIFSGKATIGSGATSVSVTFSTTYSNTSYSVTANLLNATDTNPQFQPITITAQSTTGFTAKWNDPTATANYVLSWQAIASN